MAKLGIGDPFEIKKEIKKLEYKMETEVRSFDKEKEIMKVIKGLKKKYDEAKEVNEVHGRIDQLSREIDESKKNADEVHKRVQNDAKTSQEHHEHLIKLSKEIDEFKKQEEEVFKKIDVFRKEYEEVNEKLKLKLGRILEVRQKLEENNVQLKEDKRKSDHDILRHKDMELQEKLRTKRKLTTEDLLILQKIEEEKERKHR